VRALRSFGRVILFAVRLVLASAVTVFAVGCAELGPGSDGTSVSFGKPSNGRLIDGVRLPDRGEGYTTREVWQKRGARFGTDELVDLVIGVARRMQMRVRDVRLVVADMSGAGGGPERAFHRSHQSGRDVDFVYYTRDADGKPIEPDTMRAFDAKGAAVDGSGVVVDVPRTWLLVRDLIDAPEAAVQWIFIYEPIAGLLLEHAKQIGEPDDVLARARKTLRQPGDSARHDDHMHVRIYCSPTDVMFGCVDIGPMELLVERQARLGEPAVPRTGGDTASVTTSPAAPSSPPTAGAGTVDATSIGPLLRRARPDRIDPRRGR
jgi:penicillin-insensitive murein endopeptidase